MRHLTAILLILVFLFNLFGSRLLLHYWELQEKANFQVNIHHQNTREDILEAKLKNRTSRDAFFSLINDFQKKSDSKQAPVSSVSFHFSAGDYIFQEFVDFPAVTLSKTIHHSKLKASPVISLYNTSPWQPPDVHGLSS